MKKTSAFMYEMILGVGIVLIIIFAGIFIWGETMFPDERSFTDNTIYDYNSGWTKINDDGTREEIVPPTRVQADEDGEIVIEKTVKDISNTDLYLSFNSAKQDILAYVDGELRYSYSTAKSRPFGKDSAGAIMFIPIHPSDTGKIIQIKFIGDNNYSGVMDSFEIGTQNAIIYKAFSTEGKSLICALLMLLFGASAFTVGLLAKYLYKKNLSLLFAGWAVFFAGVWVIAESECRQFIAPNFSMLSNMTYLSLIMIPFAIALYFDCLQNGKFRIVYLMVCVLVIVEALIGITLQMSGKADLIDTLVYSFILISFTFAFYLVTVIGDFVTGAIKSYWPEFIGIIVALVAGAYQIYDYYIRSPITMNGEVICFGLLFLIIMSYLRALKDIRNTEREKYAAVQAQNASTAFLTRMSHEMRTPINAILGMNKMILRESHEEQILDYARDVNGAGNYLLGIVNEVLDLAKVNAGKITIENDEYDLMNMVRECYSLVRPRAKANRLSFEVDMSDVLPSKLYGDRERVIQVITNLLTNAVKYTPAGRVTLSVDGKIKEGRLLLIVKVMDTGIGVEEENIPYLFDSFRRVGEFHQNKIEGTGLGLTITKQLVDLMDGEISVESEYGKGTVFTVVIPQGIRSVEPCGDFSMGPNGDRRVADRNEVFDFVGKILIVDDVAINLRVFAMLLKNTNLKLEYANNGSDAIDKILKNRYDIIFLDHLMPGIDGIEVLEAIKNHPDSVNKKTPIIMQTANAVVGAQEEYKRLGFSDYLAKPIKEEELRAIIKKYL